MAPLDPMMFCLHSQHDLCRVVQVTKVRSHLRLECMNHKQGRTYGRTYDLQNTKHLLWLCPLAQISLEKNSARIR